MKRFGILAAAIALASTTFAAPALAANSTSANLKITATTQSTCTALTDSSITFGSAYDPFTYPTNTPLQEKTSFGSFSTNCTSGDAISWQIDAGGNCNKGSVSNDRALADTSTTVHYLSYELYQDSSFSSATSWATTASCGSSAALGQTGGGTSTANSINVYAEIPGGQDAYVGSTNSDTYKDTVKVTLNY